MLEIHTTIVAHSKIDFKKSVVRKGLRKIGASIQKDARRMVNRKKKVSSPGELPGRTTGGLFRAIQSKVSKSGFLVSIGPRRTAEHGQNNNFYAAFLRYGTSRGIEPREDYIEAAFERAKSGTDAALQDILRDALIPRRVK